jgi:sec-independent protein translocase protein TatA
MYCSVLLILSGSDLMIIMIVVLMLFGGDKLPELARGLGKGIRDFKNASEDVKREINNQINSYEEKKAEETTVKAAPTPALLPPAEEQVASATVVEHQESVEEHKAPETEIASSIPNTIPLGDSHSTVTGKQSEETKTEPIKTT